MSGHGSLYGSNGAIPSAVYAGPIRASAVYYGTLQIWPPRPTHSPELTKFETAGNHTYTIPAWCDKIDIGVIGGGSSGAAGTIITGSGGHAGKWVFVTHDVSSLSSTLNVIVGAGGAPSSKMGAESSVSGTGMTKLSSAGGSGIHNGQLAGDDAPTSQFNGRSYVGGKGAPGVQFTHTPAHAPGGAGSGGGTFGPGTAGAAGGVWIWAYQS